MLEMDEKEKEQILQSNRHLLKYIKKIKNKINDPVFYSKLPYEVRDEEYPNLIYHGQGPIFVHVYKKRDMEDIEYHAIEPKLSKNERLKHDEIQKLIVKKAPNKDSAITDEELRKVLKELVDESIIIDEKAVKVETKAKRRFF